jgi:nitrogen fixation/metabolism regulation signal transduction histidine kinase
MAKQVAHEIKNPLTPMKLTIQHLQRAIEEGREGNSDITNKSLNVLLDQVNNLNEIATSFSLFAEMPIPKTQRFEISSVLIKTVSLHNNDKNIIVETDIEQGQFYVLGDEQLMGGIFTNLLINGIQSIPSKRQPKIWIALKKNNGRVLIKIKDNGTGIPASIRDKVFLPNFSTKFAGSGIGLAVAKRGVEHAGGRIWFETLEGEGTSFFIEIPLVD